MTSEARSGNPYQPGDLRHTFIDLVDKMAVVAAVQHEAEQAAHFERAAEPRCGNCRKWMCSNICPEERLDTLSGRRTGPHMNRYACSKYAEGSHVQGYRDQAEQHRQSAARIARQGASR